MANYGNFFYRKHLEVLIFQRILLRCKISSKPLDTIDLAFSTRQVIYISYKDHILQACVWPMPFITVHIMQSSVKYQVNTKWAEPFNWRSLPTMLLQFVYCCVPEKIMILIRSCLICDVLFLDIFFFFSQVLEELPNGQPWNIVQ